MRVYKKSLIYLSFWNESIKLAMQIILLFLNNIEFINKEISYHNYDAIIFIICFKLLEFV